MNNSENGANALAQTDEAEAVEGLYKAWYREELERNYKLIEKTARLEYRMEYLLALLLDARHPSRIIN